MTFPSLLLAAALAATLDVPAGAPLGDALARARPGDVVRLGPGVHAGSLGKIADLRIEGAGADATRLVAPEGTDGAVVTGRVELAGLTLEAGPARAALKVLGGSATLEGVALRGGAVAVFVDEGRLTGRDLLLAGTYGLLQRSGDVRLANTLVLRTKGARAGLALLRGRLELSRASVTGPFVEAAVTISGGVAVLDDVVVRDPGPTGIAVAYGELEGHDVEVAGAREVPTDRTAGLDAVLGDCVQVRRGTLRLAWSGLVRCGGSAISASAGTLRLDGVDMTTGSAGGLVLLDATKAELEGNWVTGRGPALVAAGATQVETTFDRWRSDPALWVECGAGARVKLGFGEHLAQPCANAH